MALNKKLVAPIMAAAVIGASGLSLIKTHEGLSRTAYYDPVGIPTVCYGHTGPEVVVGTKWSMAVCDQTLLDDVRFHQTYIIGPRNCLDDVVLSQNQLDALTSLTFNVGGTRMCASTLARDLKLRNYHEASTEFLKWDKARVNGKLVHLSGLTKRRQAEKRLFDTPTYRAAPNAATDSLRAVLGQS